MASARTALIAVILTAASACTDDGNSTTLRLSGGPAGTTFADDSGAFMAPVDALAAADRELFAAGRRLFRVAWRPHAFSEATVGTDGLGPLFNQRSCAGCHVRNGRGQPPEPGAAGPANGLILHLSTPGDGGPTPHPYRGAQLQDQALPGIDREGRIDLSYREMAGAFDDGAPYSLRVPVYAISGATTAGAVLFSPRVPPAVFGGGLLEAVDVAALQAAADPLDETGDGISGRLAVIDDQPSGRVIGRFGWKASRASLRDQVIEAAAEDLGLASSERPRGGCTAAQSAEHAACAQAVDLDEEAIQSFVAYLRGLAAPARRNVDNPTVMRGEDLFTEAGCATCHRPSLPTGDYPAFPALGGQTIHPYTDLLLHDMGAGLADQMPDGAATGREWRTPPLWGIGLTPTVNGHSSFLHDGRARTLMEAVLWHGGEAVASRDSVLGWSADDRAALIAFLMSL